MVDLGPGERGDGRRTAWGCTMALGIGYGGLFALLTAVVCAGIWRDPAPGGLLVPFPLAAGGTVLLVVVMSFTLLIRPWERRGAGEGRDGT